MPITILYAGITHLYHILISGESNALAPGRELIGKKKGAVNLDLNLPKIK